MSHEQRRALAEQLQEIPHESGPTTIEGSRAGFAAFMGTFPIREDVRRSGTTLGGRPAIAVEPEEAPAEGTILYFHGGSFSLGSPETGMVLTAEVAARTGVPAISLDYRLAPEHPFPAAIEDALAAYRDLLAQGLDATTIAFAGDSAGGGLAVTTCLAAREAGLPMPAAIVAFSLVADATRSGASMSTKEGLDPFFSAAALVETGEVYRGGADPAQPLLSPAVVGDLAGLPPMLLQVGTNELLLDDSVRLAARARDAGVDVVLDVTADAPHVFQAYVGTLDESGETLDRAALFLTQHLRRR